MSYYTLPRKQTMSKINPTFNDEALVPIISFSLIHYLNIAQEFVKKIRQHDYETDSHEHNIDFLYRIINPFEFIKCLGPNFLLVKLKQTPQHFIF